MPRKKSREREKREAERASAEHGGGVSEGFEQSEELLEDQASHGDPLVNPLTDAPKPETDQDSAAHGEGDEIDSTETDEETQGTRADYDQSAERKED